MIKNEIITEDNFKLTHVHSYEALDVESVNKKMEAAMLLGLRTVVVPKRIEVPRFSSEERYDLHFYKTEKIKEEENANG
jgi:hypothetical protein